jgi:hypothetical protein
LVDWTEGAPHDYFMSLCKFIEEGRKSLPQESWIQNQIDEIVELLYEVKYLLTLK